MTKKSKILEEVGLEPIENLAFEGGGVKGLVYVGALKVLKDKGVLSTVKRVGGSSAGGITAMLLGLGYTIDEITKEMSDMDFTRFQDGGDEFWRNIPKELGQGTFKKVEDVIRVLSKQHIYKGDAFLKWAKAKIGQKLGQILGKNMEEATFADLKKAIDADPTGKLNFKDIMFTASNISGNGPALQIFDFEHTPNVKIADAVRATMSYPGAFEAYPIEINGIRSIFVDGGLVNNFPTDHYDDERYLPEGGRLNTVGVNVRTLGLRVDTQDEIAKYKWSGREKTSKDVSGLTGMAKGVVGALTSDREKVRKGGFNIIQIPDCDISTLAFELSQQDKDKLIKSGVEATRDYIGLYREGSIARIKEYEDLRSFYEAMNQNDLKAKKKEFLGKIDQLVVERNSEKILGGLAAPEDAKEYEENSKKVQKAINDVVTELSLIDASLEKFENKNDVKAVLEDFNELLDLQSKQAEQSCRKLEELLLNLVKLQKQLKNMQEDIDRKLVILEKIENHPEVLKAFKEAFVAIEKLQADQSAIRVKISKLKAEIEQSPNLKLELTDKLHDLRNELSTAFIQGRNTIKANLDKGLSGIALPTNEKDILKNIVALELIKVNSNLEKQKPKNFEDYTKDLRIAKLELAQRLKKIEQDEVFEKNSKEIAKHKETLKKIEESRKYIGENPSKMYDASLSLTSIINSQKSMLLPTIARVAAFLLSSLATGGLATVAYFVLKNKGPESVKKSIDNFEKNLNILASGFTRSVKKLREEIIASKAEFLKLEAPSSKIEEYRAQLDKAVQLSMRLPEGETKNKFEKFITPELDRAKKEHERLVNLEKLKLEERDEKAAKEKPSSTS